MIDSNTAASSLIEIWRHLVTALPNGWSRERNGAVAVVTGVDVPTLNGVWVTRTDGDVSAVAALLDEVQATGLSHCLQVRPGAAELLRELAAARRMVSEEDLPLMVLEATSALATAMNVGALTIRELRSREARIHAVLTAQGFETPAEPFIELITPQVLSSDGVRCYVGEVDGEPVTTGLGVTLGDAVAIFNIATLPLFRRRGYGAAITARAVIDGFDAGATWSWLQSSLAGYSVYEGLGFQTVERWPWWIAASGNPLRT